TAQGFEVGAASSPCRGGEPAGVAVEPCGGFEVIRSCLTGHRILRFTVGGAFLRDGGQCFVQLCNDVRVKRLFAVCFWHLVFVASRVGDLHEGARGAVLAIV